MVLEVRNLVKRYAEVTALNDVSLSVDHGKIFGLLGPNGAGKTTLIRVINQITAPDSGEVLFMGKPLCREDIARIGYLPEERGLYKKMKIGEQCLYLAQLKGMSKHDAMIELKTWFERFGIVGWWDKKVEELSKGMAQKIQFIVSIIHKPDFLIFDEPFSGFDPVNVNLLTEVILELKAKGVTLILSTHSMSSVEALCDDIALINKSKVMLSGGVDEIIKSHKENVFMVEVEGHVSELNSQFELLSNEQKGSLSKLIIRIVNGSGNDLLRELINDRRLSVVSFNEKLPSMNDIFVNIVKQ